MASVFKGLKWLICNCSKLYQRSCTVSAIFEGLGYGGNLWLSSDVVASFLGFRERLSAQNSFICDETQRVLL